MGALSLQTPPTITRSSSGAGGDDSEEDRTFGAVLVGMLREDER
jgi:hypothetical protein